jgi:hypothetical protein
MSEKISWNYVAQALNGPALSGAGSVAVDAYDKLMVTLADQATQLVNLVPAGKVSLLIIRPTPQSDQLTYAVGGNDVGLEAPLVLLGSGAVGLLGPGVTSLSFTNNTGADATIEILVGRDATP